MKIGVFAGYSLPDPKSGGAFTFTYGILQALQRISAQHEFYVFSYELAWESTNPAVNFCLLTPQISSTLNIPQKMIHKILRKIDIVHTKKQYGSLLNKAALDYALDMTWFITPAYEWVQIPYIYTVWDLQHRHQSYFPEVSVTGSLFHDREKHYSSVIPRAAYVVTGNQQGKQEIMRFYGMPEERVKIIPMPTPDFALHAPKADTSILAKLPKQFFFYPAQFWPHKNHIVILHALKLLKERDNLTIHVVFTGSDKGNLSYIQAKTRELGLENQIHFLGFVSIEQIVALYQNAIAMIFASFFGPDNIPPLEAFALECPVIAASFAGAEHQLQDAALLFNPNDEQQLALAIKKMVTDEEGRKKLIILGRERARACTGDDYVKRLIGIVDEFSAIRRCWSSKTVYKHP